MQYTQNMLDWPVPADEQVYVGQRAFESSFVQPILAADLRQLHLQHAQFYLGGVWNWASWNPAGPKSVQLWALYFYKAFGKDRVEVKAGLHRQQHEFRWSLCRRIDRDRRTGRLCRIALRGGHVVLSSDGAFVQRSNSRA